MKTHSLLLFFLCGSFSCVFGQECIQSFTSDITVTPQASLKVHETITVLSTSETIRRGIVREFPTRYQGKIGNNVYVDFEVTQVLHNGRPEVYSVTPFANGKKIYIGNPHVYILPGIHTYTITYIVKRVFSFFETHDELYWNVTGNGWRLPIQEATATIHLPEAIPTQQITAEAYTGKQNSTHKNYGLITQKPNTFIFHTTQPLGIHKGLTIAVSWPKGFITYPTVFDKILFFLQDHVGIIVLLLGLLAILLFYLHSWISIRTSQPKPGTIIPLFHPPATQGPGALRFIKNMQYDNSILTAEIVAMAVRGMLTINHKKDFWHGIYTLTKNLEFNGPIAPEHEEIYACMFKDTDSIAFTRNNQAVIADLLNKQKNFYETQYGNNRYFIRYLFNLYVGFAGLILTFLLFIFINNTGEAFFQILAILYIAFGFGLFALFKRLLKKYTPEGRTLVDEIEGFLLFLSTTETERIAMVGSPPTKSPELFEKYLPYAIALGVEKQWANQFDTLFRSLEQSGNSYVPLWYYGQMGMLNSFNSATFASGLKMSLTHSITSSIASSQSAPGSSSGSGGRGSSGGGSGGGGGGGW